MTQVHAFLEANADRSPVLPKAAEVCMFMYDSEVETWQLCYNLTQFFLGALGSVAKHADHQNVNPNTLADDSYLFSCCIVTIWDVYRNVYHNKGLN